MAEYKFINSFGSAPSKKSSKKPKSTESDFETFSTIATDNNVRLPSTGPSPLSFMSILDWLNKPSEITEGFLTGGSTYDKKLDEMGITNTKGKLDWNDVISTTGRIVADPLNLVAPLKIGSGALKIAGGVGKLATKIKPVGVATDFAGALFKPGYKLSKVSPQLNDELSMFRNAVKAKQIQSVRKVGETFKDIDPTIRANLDKLVEAKAAGAALTEAENQAVMRAEDFIQTMITKPEKEAGLLRKELDAYFPRKADRDAVEAIMKFNSTAGLSTRTTKSRKYATRVEGEEAGVVYKNTMEALALRLANSETARANKQFLDRLLVGGIKDVDGNDLLKPITRKHQLLEGHVTVRVDANGMKVGDKFLGFYPTKGPTGKKIIGVTNRGANFQVPKEAAEELTRYFNTFTDDNELKQLLKGYDTMLGWWKTSVTTLFPAFHIRNEMGNLTNMWLGGFTVRDAKLFKAATDLQRGKKAVTVGGKTVTRELLEELGILGGGWYGTDVPQELAKSLGALTPFMQKTATGKAGAIAKAPVQAGRKVGRGLEENARTAFFLSRLRKGDDIKTALAQTKKYLFDYGELTAFERSALKRVLPFYTWTRKNVPLQIENLITQPGKQAAITKTLSNLFPIEDEELNSLGDWYHEGFTGKIPGSDANEDEISVLSNLGLPIEDLGIAGQGSPTRVLERELLAGAGPLGNAAGIIAQKDFFRGEEFSDLRNSYGRQAKDYPQVIKDFLDFREEPNEEKGYTTYHVDPTKFQILQAIGGRMLKGFNRPDSVSVPGTIRDLKLSEEEERQAYRDLKKLEKLLQNKGLLKEFKKAYIPKSVKGESETKTSETTTKSSSKYKFINSF